MRIFLPRKIGNGKLRNHEGAAGVDLLHQIVPPHIGCRDGGQLDRAGVVHDDIDATEFIRGFIERSLHARFVTYVNRNWQCSSTGLRDLGGGGMNGTFQLWMRFDRLGGDDDVGAIGRCSQRDRKTDSA
jgi:hypothetical protein